MGYRHGGAQRSGATCHNWTTPTDRPAKLCASSLPPSAMKRRSSFEHRPTPPVPSCDRPCCCAALSVCMLCSLSIRRPLLRRWAGTGLGSSGGRWEGGRAHGAQGRHGRAGEARRGEVRVWDTVGRSVPLMGCKRVCTRRPCRRYDAWCRSAAGGVSDNHRQRRRRRGHGHGMDGTPRSRAAMNLHHHRHLWVVLRSSSNGTARTRTHRPTDRPARRLTSLPPGSSAINPNLILTLIS